MEIYSQLSTYDWYILWRYFITINLFFVGLFSVGYYVVIMQLSKQWSSNTYKKALYSLIVISYLFGFSFPFAMGFYDPTEITGFYVSKTESIIFGLVSGTILSLVFRFLLKNNQIYWESLEKYEPYQRRKQKKLIKYEKKIRKNMPTSLLDEETMRLEAQKLLYKNEMLTAKIVFGTLIILCLLYFFPYIHVLILN